MREKRTDDPCLTCEFWRDNYGSALILGTDTRDLGICAKIRYIISSNSHDLLLMNKFQLQVFRFSSQQFCALARTGLLQAYFLDPSSLSASHEPEPTRTLSPGSSALPTPSTSSETESPLASALPEPADAQESSLGKRKRGCPRTKEVVEGPKCPRSRPRKIVVVADTTPTPAK
ncbi:hypothetical protein DFP72DRAFT_861408 [Ephemerocybe angulata]|uniref:Uncharacterized protein n=1 Tax=Ephemerocybe angulata TaxID=980116 RepID=A0A8H6H9B0_9AGAR|nr:hypothetical protein DFP72DRAFT_861408 [Tulosesus angulatus]